MYSKSYKVEDGLKTPCLVHVHVHTCAHLWHYLVIWSGWPLPIGGYSTVRMVCSSGRRSGTSTSVLKGV